MFKAILAPMISNTC